MTFKKPKVPHKMNPINADEWLEWSMSAFIQARRKKKAIKKNNKPYLNLLLAGYAGSRNTGGDVRVEEMIRQFRHIFGDHQLKMSILTIDPEKTNGYFHQVNQIQLPQVFPKFLYKTCSNFDGVVACEGSMFKSKFAGALTVMMAGALGLANAEDKISVGYGAEAGSMTPSLKKFVEKSCKESLVICRNKSSQNILDEMNIRNTSGTDTAWTFHASPESIGIAELKKSGWDGKTPILSICPINPFWWPVKPSLLKWIGNKMFNWNENVHYKSIYFHEYSRRKNEKYQNYISSIAKAVLRYQKEKNIFPILIAMEQLDEKACENVCSKMGKNIPIFSSRKYSMYDLVSIARQSCAMISSRFHGIVTSMPGKVASGGITMDERIRNLMIDRKQNDLLLEVDEENLDEKIYELISNLFENREEIVENIEKMIPEQIYAMSKMGRDFENEIKIKYPEISVVGDPNKWESYVPSLPNEVRNIMEKFA